MLAECALIPAHGPKNPMQTKKQQRCIATVCRGMNIRNQSSCRSNAPTMQNDKRVRKRSANLLRVFINNNADGRRPLRQSAKPSASQYLAMHKLLPTNVLRSSSLQTFHSPNTSNRSLSSLKASSLHIEDSGNVNKEKRC